MKYSKIIYSLLISAFVNANNINEDDCSQSGYPCCSPNCKAIFYDVDGDWGFENGEWCICRTNVLTTTTSTTATTTTTTASSALVTSVETDSSCPQSILKLGYPCCSGPDCEVIYTDFDGDWAIEDGDWCVCRKNVLSTTTATTTTTTSSVTSVETGFCSTANHSGESVKVTENKVGKIGDVDYSSWSARNNTNATFYSDGSFTCSVDKTEDFLCESGVNFGGTKTHKDIGPIYADFKINEKEFENVEYSYIGVFGYSKRPHVEFYIVDNWLSSTRPGDWVGNKKHGDFMIDGAMYTVYESPRIGIDDDDMDFTSFKQFISVRKEARNCGTINITAHLEQFEKLGIRFGKFHNIMVYSDAGTNNNNIRGFVDFSYAKIYTGLDADTLTTTTTTTTTTTNTSDIETIPTTVTTTTTSTASVETGFCSTANHSGESVEVTKSKVGKIGDVDYKSWSISSDISATFYSDGSFTCSVDKTEDFLCESGINFGGTKTHKDISPIYADFKFNKKEVENAEYFNVGIYGYTEKPHTEFYIIDNWLTPTCPGWFPGTKKHGDFMIDGAMYTVYENPRIEVGNRSTYKQFVSIRKEVRNCGTINITAHFEQWVKLGAYFGKIQDIRIYSDAGSDENSISGSVDFSCAKIYTGVDADTTTTTSSGSIETNSSCPQRILNQGYPCCSPDCHVLYTDSDGSWGVENNDWCFCKENILTTATTTATTTTTTTTSSVTSIETNPSCPQSILKLGYPCCSGPDCNVIYTDSDGDWAFEDGDWCVCRNNI